MWGSKLLVKGQLIRQRDSEGRAAEDDNEICNKLNDKLKTVYTADKKWIHCEHYSPNTSEIGLRRGLKRQEALKLLEST